MSNRLALPLIVSLILPACSAGFGIKTRPEQKPHENPFVLIKTSMGDIYAELFPKEAPRTVENFLGLAEGTRAWTDPKTGKKVTRPFYDGLIVHRVENNLRIVTGCPLGTGTGGPGYQLADEINAVDLNLHKIKAVGYDGRPHRATRQRNTKSFRARILPPLTRSMGIKTAEELKARAPEVSKRLNLMTLKEYNELLGYRYDKKLKSRPPQRGTLVMENSGPNTNGSRFFINIVDTDWLTGSHTVFGAVIKGMWTVDQIGELPVNMKKKPLKDVVIISIRRVPRPKALGE